LSYAPADRETHSPARRDSYFTVGTRQVKGRWRRNPRHRMDPPGVSPNNCLYRGGRRGVVAGRGRRVPAWTGLGRAADRRKAGRRSGERARRRPAPRGVGMATCRPRPVARQPGAGHGAGAKRSVSTASEASTSSCPPSGPTGQTTGLAP